MPILTATISGADTVVGSLTFHTLTIILCGAFTAATFLFSGVQLFLHATHFSNPGQQTQYGPPHPPKRWPNFKLTLVHQDSPHRRLSSYLRPRLLSCWLYTFCSNLSPAMGRRVRSRCSYELLPFASCIYGTGSATAGRVLRSIAATEGR